MAGVKGVAADSKIKKRQAQDRALGFYADGLTVVESVAKVHRHPDTWKLWLKEPWFAARAKVIQARRTDPGHRQGGDSFENFRLGYFNFATYWHQQQILEAINKAGGQEIVLILLPPEWGKTTVLEDYICYVLSLVDPNHRFAIIKESQHEARKMVGRLQRRMVEGPLADAYGPYKVDERAMQKPWNADYFTIRQATHDERDFSVEARGAGSHLYGARYDTVLLDDVQSRQSLTPGQTEKLFDFIRGDIVTRPGTEGRILIVGTRIGPGDIYETMLEADFIDHLVKIPALDEEGRSLFPETKAPDGKTVGWSEVNLAKRRHKVGEQVWAQVYMQEPISKIGAPFTEDRLLKSLDPALAIGGVPPGLGLMASIDPALTGFASIKVCAYDAKNLWLVDTANIAAPGRYEELFALVEQYSERWHPSEWIFEVNAMQKGLARDDRVRALADRFGFRIVEHTTRTNKLDPAIGVAAMADAFGRGEVKLPDHDEASKRALAPLMKELRAWRPDIPTRELRQDEVMALWFCYLRWTQIKKNLDVARAPITIGGTPWSPMGYGYSKPRRQLSGASA